MNTRKNFGRSAVVILQSVRSLAVGNVELLGWVDRAIEEYSDWSRGGMKPGRFWAAVLNEIVPMLRSGVDVNVVWSRARELRVASLSWPLGTVGWAQ